MRYLKVVQKTAVINKIRSEKGEDPYEFDYILLCNKICGASHYAMQMKIVVFSTTSDCNLISSVVNLGVNPNSVTIPGTQFICALKCGIYAECNTS